MTDYSMVEECTDSYRVLDQADGRTRIEMVVPRRFRDLWISRLSDLQTTDEEIAEYEPRD